MDTWPAYGSVAEEKDDKWKEEMGTREAWERLLNSIKGETETDEKTLLVKLQQKKLADSVLFCREPAWVGRCADLKFSQCTPW